MKIRVVGDLTRFVETDSVEIAGAELTLETALGELARRHPRLGRELFDERGRMHHAVVLMAGERCVVWPTDRETPIKEGDELLVTRFHSGG